MWPRPLPEKHKPFIDQDLATPFAGLKFSWTMDLGIRELFIALARRKLSTCRKTKVRS